MGRKSLPINHDFFKVWSSDMAWVLGFWATDGCAHLGKSSTYICFTQKEKSILQKIKSVLCSKHKISKHSHGWQLSFASDEIYKDICLIFHVDNVSKKSNTIPFPYIEPLFIRDFIRGCIDGDGCLSWQGSVPSIQFYSGSENFVYGFIDSVFQETGIILNLFKHKKKYFCAASKGIKAVAFARWLYFEQDITIDTKAEKAIDFLEWKPDRIITSSLTPKMCEMFSDIIPEAARNRCLERACVL